MAAAKSSSRIVGRAGPTPTGLLEYAPLVSALVAGGKATFDIASKIADDVQKNRTPLSIQVLDSRVDGGDYLLLLRLTSFSGRDLAINAVESNYPSKVQPVVERDRLGFDEDSTPRRKIAVPVDPALPFRLPPLASQDLRLRLDRAAAQKQLHQHRHAKLVVRYEILGVLDPQTLDLQVRLRDDVLDTAAFTTENLRG